MAPADGDVRRQARRPVPEPVPAYLPTAGSPLAVDKELYNAFQAAPRVLIEAFTLPIRSGRAWTAPAGSIVRISTPEGPQVGKFSPRPLPPRRQPVLTAPRQVTSTSGTCTTRESASGLRGRGSCTPRTSPRTTGCGPACRTCGRW